jgi:hypothetical protein
MQPQPQSGSGTTRELASDAKHMGESALNRVHSEIDARKDGAASQARSVSSAMDRAAGNLDDGAPDWFKSALQKGAQQVQRFADTIERKDSRQLFQEISDFARQSPGTFLAGCAAAGFAAARIAKAGSEAPDPAGGMSSTGSAMGSSHGAPSSAGQQAYESSYPSGQQYNPGAATRGEFA